MNIFKNLIIDYIGKRNNNVLNKIWNNNYIVYKSSLINSNELIIFDFDNRLGDSVYVSILINEIITLNCTSKIYIVSNKENIIYDFLCENFKINKIIYKSKFDLLFKLYKLRNLKDLTSINLDSGLRFLHFAAIRITNSKYNIGFNKEIFGIININLTDKSISFNINHHQNKINEILNLYKKNYDNFNFHDFDFVKKIRSKFKLEKKPLIFINCTSSDRNRKIDKKLLEKIIGILKPHFTEIHINSEYKISNELTQKIVSANYYFNNFEDCLNMLKKYKYIITIDTAFTHLSSLLDLPTFVLYNDNNFNEYVWYGKMHNYSSSNINYQNNLILSDLKKFLNIH